jgi:hypothetical protein
LEKISFFFENLEIFFFRTVRDVHLEIGLPIVVFHADADGTNPSSVSQFVKGPQLKNQIDQFLLMGGFSGAFIFGTIRSNSELAPGLSVTISPEHESTKIEDMECTYFSWEANHIPEKFIFLQKYKIRHFSAVRGFKTKPAYPIVVSHG